MQTNQGASKTDERNFFMVQLSVRYLIHSMTSVFFLFTIKPPLYAVHFALYLEVSAHISSDSLVVKETLDATDGADSDVLIPQFPVRKVHNVLLSNGVNDTLNLARVHPAAGSDELTADIFGDGRCAVQRQEDRCLQLGLGTLNLGFADIA